MGKLAAHQTHYEDEKARRWPIAGIGVWAAERREHVAAKLPDTHYGKVFEAKVAEYQSDVGDGWHLEED